MSYAFSEISSINKVISLLKSLLSYFSNNIYYYTLISYNGLLSN